MRAVWPTFRGFEFITASCHSYLFYYRHVIVELTEWSEHLSLSSYRQQAAGAVLGDPVVRARSTVGPGALI